MAKKEPSATICPTCNNVETCARRPGHEHPVFYCEQFDSSSESAAEVRIGIAAGPMEKVNIAMGLCCNCGNRNSCTSAQMPGGIWHCEEYA